MIHCPLRRAARVAMRRPAVADAAVRHLGPRRDTRLVHRCLPNRDVWNWCLHLRSSQGMKYRCNVGWKVDVVEADYSSQY